MWFSDVSSNKGKQNGSTQKIQYLKKTAQSCVLIFFLIKMNGFK